MAETKQTYSAVLITFDFLPEYPDQRTIIADIPIAAI